MLGRALQIAVVRAVVGAVVVAAVGGSSGACSGDGARDRDRAQPGTGRASVISVTDGDTLRVRIDGRTESVRLIGIDTPEVHGQGGLRECFGKEASQRTAELLPAGSAVRLVRDAEERDRYGRVLAYVYRDDGLFVNLTLAREGFAAPLTIPPNVAHRDAFADAAASARDGNLGLWGRCGGPDTPIRRITSSS